MRSYFQLLTRFILAIGTVIFPGCQQNADSFKSAELDVIHTRLYLAPGIFGPKTPKSNVVGILGKPDKEYSNYLFYYIPQPKKENPVRSIRFVFDKDKNVISVDSLDANGKQIVFVNEYE